MGSAQEYEAFRITSDGALDGVGLVLAADPESGYLVSQRGSEQNKKEKEVAEAAITPL